jgi:hypothetical protein
MTKNPAPVSPSATTVDPSRKDRSFIWFAIRLSSFPSMPKKRGTFRSASAGAGAIGRDHTARQGKLNARRKQPPMSTQAALYADIDLELAWSEHELPERERTKHVHRLHPYLGKYVPQLVETFLTRYATEGDLVWDPFCGSGTTLVEANAFGARAAGCDVSAFNCLLARVKTAEYDPPALLSDVVRLSAAHVPAGSATPSPYLWRWYAPGALAQLLAFRERIRGTAYPDLWRVVLSRAARSARLARHDDLDFPKEPVAGEYFCHKHRRTCRPVDEAEKFLRRYVATRPSASWSSPRRALAGP